MDLVHWMQTSTWKTFNILGYSRINSTFNVIRACLFIVWSVLEVVQPVQTNMWYNNRLQYISRTLRAWKLKRVHTALRAIVPRFANATGEKTDVNSVSVDCWVHGNQHTWKPTHMETNIKPTSNQHTSSQHTSNQHTSPTCTANTQKCLRIYTKSPQNLHKISTISSHLQRCLYNPDVLP